MTTCKFTKKALSHILFHVFCHHFLGTHHNYFFRRGFERVRTKFLLENFFQALLVIYLFHYDSSNSTSFMLMWHFWIYLEYGFSQVNSNLLQYKDYKNILLFSDWVWYVVILDKKWIALYHSENTFLFYFEICNKLTLSLIILTMAYSICTVLTRPCLNDGEMITSHLMFELHFKTTW